MILCILHLNFWCLVKSSTISNLNVLRQTVPSTDFVAHHVGRAAFCAALCAEGFHPREFHPGCTCSKLPATHCCPILQRKAPRSLLYSVRHLVSSAKGDGSRSSAWVATTAVAGLSSERSWLSGMSLLGVLAEKLAGDFVSMGSFCCPPSSSDALCPLMMDSLAGISIKENSCTFPPPQEGYFRY